MVGIHATTQALSCWGLPGLAKGLQAPLLLGKLGHEHPLLVVLQPLKSAGGEGKPNREIMGKLSRSLVSLGAPFRDPLAADLQLEILLLLEALQDIVGNPF